ncbi:MAG: FAD-dependent oxidoreductase [Nanohaloarchaea archaeon]|nr:FAD-dependent oxidoreductase [Candidatus Nanohaloarchaea archaeon]
MPEKVVITGAGFFGLNAALKLAAKGYEVELLDKEKQHEYTPGLIDIFRDRVSSQKLELNLEEFLEDTSVKFSDEKVTGFIPEEDRVETDSSAYNYDYLVLGLGGEPNTFGTDIGKVETCYRLSDAKRIDQRLEESESALVIGSGYVGLEVASELREKGLEVEVLDVATRPMVNANIGASEIALDYMNENDIVFRGDKNVETVERHSAILENGGKVEADIVIWTTGIQASKLVQRDFETVKNGLEVNKGLCSQKYSNVFAAGDCADLDVMKTAHNAMNQAETIAKNIEKGEAENLEGFEEKFPAILISMGEDGMLEYGEKAYRSKWFRKLKDLVRIRYYYILRKKKLKLKLLSLFR